jgi:hypothetical protein
MQQLTPICAIRRNERGAVLVAALVIMVVLMGVSTIATYSGYTNLVTSTNLRLASRARAHAEANVSEALYRLATRPGEIGAIIPDLEDPDWQLAINFTTGDTDAADHVVSTIQDPDDWPEHQPPQAVTLQYKKQDANCTENCQLVFHNRAIPPPNPPFAAFQLPIAELGGDLLPGVSLEFLAPVVTLAENVTYQLLCDPAEGLLGGLGGGVTSEVGDLLGVCPSGVDLADIGYPVIQMRTTGLDARGAEREFLAEVVRTVQFIPVAPLSAGGNVSLNSVGFIDGVNHHPDIQLGNPATVYGDNDTETTRSLSLLGIPIAVRDSPDDSYFWDSAWSDWPSITLFGVPVSTCLLACSAAEAIWHGIANTSLLLLNLNPLFYTSFPRLFNMQVSATDETPAWIGVERLEAAITETLDDIVGLDPVIPAQLGIWTEVNRGYTAAIALSSGATISNAPEPPNDTTVTDYNNIVWNRGVFSWRINNKNDHPDYINSTSVPAETPAAGAVKHCGPPVLGDRPPLVCRPAVLATFPTFQTYIGFADAEFQELLDTADTTSATQTPEGFTYLEGNSTISAAVPSPDTDEFGLIYADSDLHISGTLTFKGLIFVNGNLQINGGAKLTVLGAVMVRGTVTQVGDGSMTLLYSREAANRGIQAARPWRILSWADADVQNQAE